MDIKSAQAEGFVKAPPKGVLAVLLYGPDAGQISERASRLAAHFAKDPKEPGEIIRLDDSDLSGDPDRLGVELRTIPMFGGRKIVRLTADGRLKPDLITDLLEGPLLAGVLILEAGNLKPESKLRAAFVSAANAAAVACYADDERSIGTLIDEVARAHKLDIPGPVREHLAAQLGADRTLSRGELEKLALYMGDGASVALEDVDAIAGDAAELSLDMIVHAAASGNAREALKLVDRAIGSGEDEQSILLALQRHVLRLHAIASAVAQGRPLDSVLRGQRPPLNFKVEPLIRAELRIWPLPRLCEAVARIQATIAATRQTPALDREKCERLVLDLARLAAMRA